MPGFWVDFDGIRGQTTAEISTQSSPVFIISVWCASHIFRCMFNPTAQHGQLQFTFWRRLVRNIFEVWWNLNHDLSRCCQKNRVTSAELSAIAVNPNDIHIATLRFRAHECLWHFVTLLRKPFLTQLRLVSTHLVSSACKSHSRWQARVKILPSSYTFLSFDTCPSGSAPGSLEWFVGLLGCGLWAWSACETICASIKAWLEMMLILVAWKVGVGGSIRFTRSG